MAISMDQVLQEVTGLPGVQGAFLFDDKGKILHFHGTSSAAKPEIEQASRYVARAIEYVQMQHREWEQLSILFSSGRVLVRKIGKVKLAVIGDASLQPSLANVAIRAAAAKLQQTI